VKFGRDDEARGFRIEVTCSAGVAHTANLLCRELIPMAHKGTEN